MSNVLTELHVVVKLHKIRSMKIIHLPTLFHTSPMCRCSKLIIVNFEHKKGCVHSLHTHILFITILIVRFVQFVAHFLLIKNTRWITHGWSRHLYTSDIAPYFVDQVVLDYHSTLPNPFYVYIFLEYIMCPRLYILESFESNDQVKWFVHFYNPLFVPLH